MIAEVRAADTPVDAQVPRPRSSSTMLWIIGCWMWGGFGRSKRSTRVAPAKLDGLVAERGQPQLGALAADDDLVGALGRREQPLRGAQRAAARAEGERDGVLDVAGRGEVGGRAAHRPRAGRR